MACVYQTNLVSFYVIHGSLHSSVELSSVVHRAFTIVHDKRDKSGVERMITVHEGRNDGPQYDCTPSPSS